MGQVTIPTIAIIKYIYITYCQVKVNPKVPVFMHY
jgi:hypothetical protein